MDSEYDDETLLAIEQGILDMCEHCDNLYETAKPHQCSQKDILKRTVIGNALREEGGG